MKFLTRFSRITSSGRTFVPQIDGLRFVAIVAVMAYHVRELCAFHFGIDLSSLTGVNGAISQSIGAGAYGVELFFAISGFILALPFAKNYLRQAPPVSLRAYYLRRLTRLEPPYIIHLGFLFLLCWLVLRKAPGHPLLAGNDWLKNAAGHILASLFYSNGLILHQRPYPNLVLWSLEVEVQFYLLAPLLTKVFMISRKWMRRAVIIAVIIAFSAFRESEPPYAISSSLAGSLQYFFVGFLLCDLYLSRRWDGSTVRHILGDLCFAGALGFFLVFCSFKFVRGYVLPWMVLLVCVGAFRGIACSRLMSIPWVTTVGGMCYTIYMYHLVLFRVLIRATLPVRTHIFWLDLTIQTTIMCVLTIAICAPLFLLFERPFMKRDWHIQLWRAVFRPKPVLAEEQEDVRTMSN